MKTIVIIQIILFVIEIISFAVRDILIYREKKGNVIICSNICKIEKICNTIAISCCCLILLLAILCALMYFGIIFV